MTSTEIRNMWFKFFESKGHKILESAPLVPIDDDSLLFINAGVTPLKKYFDGTVVPDNKRLASIQKCIRTNDIDNVGVTKRHQTFFEMMGNFSVGDYFRDDALTFAMELLTGEDWFAIPKEKIYVTVYTDDEAAFNKWVSLGLDPSHIARLDGNFWEIGEGPCGPDTEIFYFRSEEETPEVFDPNDKRWVEIWNNVFMQYNHVDEKTFVPLQNKNVDTGMGVERVTAILEGVDDNYQTSIFKDVIAYIEKISGLSYKDLEYARSMRILADHIRASVMIIGDDSNIMPSNTDQGYVLRRLIRRAIRHAKRINIDVNTDFERVIAKMFIDKYKSTYHELDRNEVHILDTLSSEKKKFSKTLERGLKEFEKIIKNLNDNEINATNAFKLYDTYGFPIELTIELASELGITVDKDGFDKKFSEHQEKSRLGSAQKFKGGLASTGDTEIKYHTATHLLNAALKEVLGSHVHQKGSNITAERMRFDFSHDSKMTREELKKTEDLVNSYIKASIPVIKTEEKKEDAIADGAEAMFIEKYGDIVTVYTIGDVSKELCGGPHVNNTSELGHFKIIKEEASSAGVRRIKAILE